MHVCNANDDSDVQDIKPDLFLCESQSGDSTNTGFREKASTCIHSLRDLSFSQRKAGCSFTLPLSDCLLPLSLPSTPKKKNR